MTRPRNIDDGWTVFKERRPDKPTLVAIKPVEDFRYAKIYQEGPKDYRLTLECCDGPTQVLKESRHTGLFKAMDVGNSL